jgi:fatty acid desaturase
MRLVWSARQLESLFHDDVFPDDDGGEGGGEGDAAGPSGRAADDEGGLRQARGQRQQQQQEEEEEEEEEEDGAEDDGDAPASETQDAVAAAAAATSERERARLIREALSAAAEDARARHPALLPRNQDAVGLAVLASSACLLVLLFVLHARGLAPAALVVPAAALLTSLLHELEHDLIHSLYFRGRAWTLPRLPFGGAGAPPLRLTAIDAALAVCFAFRPSTINPWARRALHLHHHRLSGTAGDLEERAITNGLAWSPLRLAATGDNLLAILLRPHQSLAELRSYLRSQPAAVRADAQARLRLIAANALGYAPFGLAHYAAWWSFLAVGAAGLLLGEAPEALLLRALGGLPGAGAAWPALRFYAAAFGAPQFLRTFCLHFVSSNVHYYRGNSGKGGKGAAAVPLVDQTQIIDAPLFWPLQLFCFNFGGTHALHHFAPAQPFYLRQAVSRDARVRAALRAGGVRFNDLGTFARANRLPAGAAAATKKTA